MLVLMDEDTSQVSPFHSLMEECMPCAPEREGTSRCVLTAPSSTRNGCWLSLMLLGTPTLFTHSKECGRVTLRDMFRWADRYRLEVQTEASHDWLQHLADDGEACQTFLLDHQPTHVPVKLQIKLLSSSSGYMLLAGRVRKPEEEATILSILEKHFKRTVNPENLFCQKQVTSQFSKRNITPLHSTTTH